MGPAVPGECGGPCQKRPGKEAGRGAGPFPGPPCASGLIACAASPRGPSPGTCAKVQEFVRVAQGCLAPGFRRRRAPYACKPCSPGHAGGHCRMGGIPDGRRDGRNGREKFPGLARFHNGAKWPGMASSPLRAHKCASLPTGRPVLGARGQSAGAVKGARQMPAVALRNRVLPSCGLRELPVGVRCCAQCHSGQLAFGACQRGRHANPGFWRVQSRPMRGWLAHAQALAPARCPKGGAGQSARVGGTAQPTCQAPCSMAWQRPRWALRAWAETARMDKSVPGRACKGHQWRMGAMRPLAPQFWGHGLPGRHRVPDHALVGHGKAGHSKRQWRCARGGQPARAGHAHRRSGNKWRGGGAQAAGPAAPRAPRLGVAGPSP